MRIGLLEAGRVPADLVDAHGTYPDLFTRLLAEAMPEMRMTTWSAIDGVLPPQADAADAWVVTGSKHGVYDPLPFIPPLRAFLAAAYRAGVPIVGICFGHQLLAEALGGRAIKSDRGWGVGLRDYALDRVPGWIADGPARIAMYAMHQDQVVEVPPEATVLAGNEHCPYAFLAYGDPENPDAVTIQSHPEFTEAYTRDLIRSRSGYSVPAEDGRRGLETMTRADDGARFARWIATWLRRKTGARAAA